MENYPLVSVILPVRNEEPYIRSTLKHLLGQNYPTDRMEILVADGESIDQTAEIVREVAAEDSRVRLLSNPDRIMATGFNRAYRQSQGDYILMMGGHSLLSPTYIQTCVDALQSQYAGCAGGVTVASAQTPQAEAIAAAMRSRFGVGGANFRVGAREKLFVDTVAFGLYDRKVFEEIGLLDESLVRNQDDEFNYRMLSHGYQILLLPDVQVVYSSRSSLKTLWKQYFEYGLWKVRVFQLHPRQMRLRHFIPPLLALSLLSTTTAALIHPLGVLLLCGIIGVYGVSVLVASSILALSLEGRHYKWLPLVFVCLHLAYGMGFLTGLIRFRSGWWKKTDLLYYSKPDHVNKG